MPAFLLAALLAAPGPSPARVDRRLQLGCRLLVSEAAAPGPEFLRQLKRVDGQRLSAAAWERVCSRLGQHPLRTVWMLVDGQDRLMDRGSTLPQGQSLGGLMQRCNGGRAVSRSKVLEEVPDHGEARLAEALERMEALAVDRLGTGWSGKGGRPLRWRIALSGSGERGLEEDVECREALRKVAALPRWSHNLDLSDPEEPLRPLLLGLNPWVQQGLDALLASAAEACMADALHPNHAANLGFLLPLASRKALDEVCERLAGSLGVPGQPWPPLPVLEGLWEAYGEEGRWGDLAETLKAFPRKPDPLFLRKGDWERFCAWKAHLGLFLGACESHREGWEVLPGWLEQLRAVAGGAYKPLAKRLVALGRRPDSEEGRERLAQAMDAPSKPYPPSPAVQPFSLLLGSPEALRTWRTDLALNPVLDPWTPEELNVGAGRGGGWLLKRGPEGLGQGPGLPVPHALADLLALHGPSRLDRLAQRAEEPGLLRLKGELLESSLPHAGREGQLAVTLRRGWMVPTTPLAWDPNVWFVEGRRVLPELEQALRRWPLEGALWEAHAFWASFVPAHPGTGLTASAMPPWDAGAPLLLRLGERTHARVRRAFDLAAHPKGALQWAQASWDAWVQHRSDLPWEEQRRRETFFRAQLQGAKARAAQVEAR